MDCASAGLSPDADNPVTPELVEWANVLVVMEQKHKSKLASLFQRHLANKRVVCLNIPDNYRFMEPALVKLLRSKGNRPPLRRIRLAPAHQLLYIFGEHIGLQIHGVPRMIGAQRRFLKRVRDNRHA